MRKHLRDESGAIKVVVLMVIFIALFTTPFFLDFASVYFARRIAQTGSDAGSLAAAKDYARALSITWHGGCGEAAESVMRRYSAYVRSVAADSGLGYNSARTYAGVNQNELAEYRCGPSASYRTVDGVRVPHVRIFVTTKKPVYLLYQRLYGKSFETPAKAAAEVLMTDDDHWTDHCTVGEESVVRHHYRFYWKIRLVE